MRRSFLVLTLVCFVWSACSRSDRRYPLTGQVLAVDTERQELTVKHEDIQNFMPAMTMPFKVRNEAALRERKPGDLIKATLVVEESTGYLEQVVKVGEAPLPPDAEAALAVRRMIAPGAEVPDAEFTDQDGRTRKFSDWRGKIVVVTFIYTRCPLPDFCPLMDRHFGVLQQAIRQDDRLAKDVRLLSVSFDPDYDTPEILRSHAARVGADPEIWSYVTGPRGSVDAFAGAFGVTVMRDDKPLQEIVHNLRTAVIDPNGRLVTVFNGNDWKPEQAVEAIRKVHAAR